MKIFLVEGKRTPFGKFGGSLSGVTPVDLAVHASKALLNEIHLSAEKIDQVLLGNVITSSTDTMYGGRHLALKIGCPEKTPGMVTNRLCGSGIQVILDACRLIKLGESECVLAAGTENMSMAPHLTYGGRFGTKYGSLQVVDMLLDALTDKYAGTPMGITAENLAEKYELTREECDQFALSSHFKAAQAYAENLLQGEIAPFELRKGLCAQDEHLRADSTPESMAKLRPAFKKDGVVTPASASGVVDGASAVLIASEKFCHENKLNPIAEIIDGQVIGVDPTIMGIGPVPATLELLSRQNMGISDIDLFEINEAFAPQTLACAKELKIDLSKLNIWGGAIALGHPLAASGTRITHTLARQLQHRGKKWGVATACIGGGQGISILLKKA